MKNILLTLTVITILFSCKKEEPIAEKKYTLSGQLFDTCNGAPLANDTLIFKMSKWRWIANDIIETAIIKTDSEGYFKYSYTFKEELNQAVLKDKKGKDIIELKPNNSYNFGKFVVNPVSNYQYQLKFNNTYQMGDTLYISYLKSADSIIKIAAPFKDTLLPEIQSFSRYILPEFENRNKNVGYGKYSIHGNPSSTSVWYESFSFNVDICNNNQIVTIEIN